MRTPSASARATACLLLCLASPLLAQAGALDAGFGTGGLTITPANPEGSFYGVATQSDGKVVAVGVDQVNGSSSKRWIVARYDVSGALDPSFGTGGKVLLLGTTSDARAHDVAVQPDGKIVVVGDAAGPSSLDFCVARLTTTGALDTSFGSGGFAFTNLGSGGSPSSRVDVAYAVAL